MKVATSSRIIHIRHWNETQTLSFNVFFVGNWFLEKTGHEGIPLLSVLGGYEDYRK